MKFGTLFSGGELAGVGIAAAGWEHAWGVEYDPAIAAVAQANGFDVTVADVLACDPHDFAPVDALHASPVCTRASIASADGLCETCHDHPLVPIGKLCARCHEEERIPGDCYGRRCRNTISLESLRRNTRRRKAGQLEMGV